MNVVIWGIGKYTKTIIRDIQEHTSYNISYIVNGIESQESEAIEDIPIIMSKEFYSLFDIDIVIIGISSNCFIEDILYNLYHHAYQGRIFIIQWNAMQFHKPLFDKNEPVFGSVVEFDMNKPRLILLQTNVVDYCNLNCKACFNFSPYVKKKAELDLIQFEKDLKRIMELFGGVKSFYLLGGEPLMNEELLIEATRLVRNYLKDTDIRIVSNGVLIPKMSLKFWNMILENNVVIDISVYPPTFKMKDKIEKTLKQSGCLYNFNPEDGYITHFWKRLLPKKHEIIENARMCLDTSEHHLQDGKIYKCSPAKLIQYFDEAENTNYYHEDYVNLYEETDPWSVFDKLYNPIKLCRFCKTSLPKKSAPNIEEENEDVIIWERISEKACKEDWIIEE